MKKLIFKIPGNPALESLGVAEENGAIVRVDINPALLEINPAEGETPLLLEAKRQLLEYLEGGRRVFDLPLVFPRATPFQSRVWAALMAIPYSKVITYGELARRVGCPGGARAAGQANAKNPLPIIVPCHRVVAVSGLGGYLGNGGSGTAIKKYLLETEGHGKA